MTSATPLALLTALACLGLALQVGLRRERSDLTGMLLAVLVSLLLWSVGLGVHDAASDAATRWSALRIAFLGMFCAPWLWLLLAVRHAWPERVRDRPGLSVAALVLALGFYVALLTNESHHGVIRAETDARNGPYGWTGPLMDAFAVLGSACVLAGSLIYARDTHQLWRSGELRRAVLLGFALAVLLGLLASTLAGAFPQAYPGVPAALTLATLALAVSALRYPLVAPVPLSHRDIFDQLRDGLIVTDRAGRVLDHNPAASRLLGRDLEGGDLRDLLQEAGGSAGLAAAEAVLAEADPSQHPSPCELRTEKDRRIEVRAVPIQTDGNPSGSRVALLRDRTEARRYAEILRRTQKLETVGTLAAGVAHEINNPLAFVRANLGEMQRLGALVDARRAVRASQLTEELAELGELAAEAREGIDRIERIAADMRRLSEAPALGFAYVDLNAVVEEAARLANLRRNALVAVSLHLDPDLPQIPGSAQLLIQALLNLMINARQALDGVSDAAIEIETRSEAGDVLICVSDNGPGIDEELRARIFEPFYTTKDPSEGTGLGLSIAADIARDHGGGIEVAASPGGGSRFSLRLPGEA